MCVLHNCAYVDVISICSDMNLVLIEFYNQQSDYTFTVMSRGLLLVNS